MESTVPSAAVADQAVPEKGAVASSAPANSLDEIPLVTSAFLKMEKQPTNLSSGKSTPMTMSILIVVKDRVSDDHRDLLPQK